MIFRRKSAVVDQPTPEQLNAEIDELVAANREQREVERERRILELRHRLGATLAGESTGARFAEPDVSQLPPPGAIAEVDHTELTPEMLRAGMLRDGAVLVRGLLDADQALGMGEQIELAVQARESGTRDDGYYEEFDPGAPVDLSGEREWVGDGGLWAADSPKLMAEMLEAFEQRGLRRVIHGYLGETPAISIQKCTLRKVNPDTGTGWHQDGAFLGEVRALNVWVALSRCGDEAPGLDVVPKRLEEIVPTGTEGATFNWSVAPDVAERVAAPEGVARPIFNPGDALLFDEMNLHSTAVDPAMTKPRYAIESWFFGLSGFPSEYVPIAY